MPFRKVLDTHETNLSSPTLSGSSDVTIGQPPAVKSNVAKTQKPAEVSKAQPPAVKSNVAKTQKPAEVSKAQPPVNPSDVSTSSVTETNVLAEPKSNLDTIMEQAVELATESDGMEKDLTDLLSEISKLEIEIETVDKNDKQATNFMIQMQAQYDLKKNLEEHSYKVLEHLRRRQMRQKIISLKSIHVARQILICITQAEDFAKGCENWLLCVEDAKNKRTDCSVGPLDFFDQVKTCTEVMKKHFDTHKDSLMVK